MIVVVLFDGHLIFSYSDCFTSQCLHTVQSFVIVHISKRLLHQSQRHFLHLFGCYKTTKKKKKWRSLHHRNESMVYSTQVRVSIRVWRSVAFTTPPLELGCHLTVLSRYDRILKIACTIAPKPLRLHVISTAPAKKNLSQFLPLSLIKISGWISDTCKE